MGAVLPMFRDFQAISPEKAPFWPIFRDFQALFPGTVSTWPMFRHFQAILLPKGFSARFVEGMEPLERAMVYNRWRIELTCEACLAAWWRREM